MTDDVHRGIISSLLDRLQAMTDWSCRARWLLEEADVTWTTRTTEQEAALRALLSESETP